MSDGTMSIRRREMNATDQDADSTPKYHSATHRHMGEINEDADGYDVICYYR